MEARRYGSFKTVQFDPKSIVYVEEKGLECKTHFISRVEISLAYQDLEDILCLMPQVYNIESCERIYVNTDEIVLCSTGGLRASIEFRNGERLEHLSRYDVEKNVFPCLDNERGL